MDNYSGGENVLYYLNIYFVTVTQESEVFFEEPVVLAFLGSYGKVLEGRNPPRGDIPVEE